MAAAIPFITTAFTIVSAISTAVGAVNQGKAASNAAAYNAAAATRNADIARQQGAANAEAQQRHATHVIGASRAAYGASGITSEGSPLDVLEMSAANAELDKQNILYSAELKAMGYEDTATLETMAGTSAKARGYEQAGSAILMGTAKAYSQRPVKSAQKGYQFGDYGAYDYSFDGL